MDVEDAGGVSLGEHPLMSNRTLRAMHAGMVKAQAVAGEARSLPRAQRAAAMRDTACFVSTLVGLGRRDLVFGCRPDGVAEAALGAVPGAPAIEDGVRRLYAAAGAALAVRGGKERRVVLAFFERQEVGGEAWLDGLRMAAELPLLVVVLPRWKGRESTVELCKQARGAGVPGIPVDAEDAVAIYRVAQESLVRARMNGGAALIEGVVLPEDGEPVSGLLKLERYLRRRGLLSRA